MSEIIIPMEAVQYLEIIKVFLLFVGVACLGLFAVCLSILLGGD